MTVMPVDVGSWYGLGRLWTPTDEQAARIARIDAAVPKTRTLVYALAPGSMLALRTYGGELAWLEVLPPAPDALIAWDTGEAMWSHDVSVPR